MQILVTLLLCLAPLAHADKTVLVGDSHMAGTLGDALVPLLGGPDHARRYGIVSGSSEMTYTSFAPVKIICPKGCAAVCPATGVGCPYHMGYRRPQDKNEMQGRLPVNFPRIQGILAEEKTDLTRVVIELGTNDAEIYGCSDTGVNKMGALLDQVIATHPKSCAYIGPPAYHNGSPIYNRCGPNYDVFVKKLLAMARRKGCTAIDSRKALTPSGAPILCVQGGYHCTPGQAAIWAALVASQLK